MSTSQRLMELEENCAVHMCGTRKTSFRVPARLLHGGLSVPVCMGPGSLLVNTSSVHRSRGIWLACIAHRFIAIQTVPQLEKSPEKPKEKIELENIQK